MEWLNASVTFLNSAAMRRSKMEQRGVWLTLMSYCIQQENSGRIEKASDWADWDWVAVCGVRKKDCEGDSLLWHWEDGGTLIVFGYPVEKQEEVKARRDAGRRGGQERARRASSTAADATSSTPSSSASRSASTERKGKEGKGKEEEGKRTQGAGAPVCLVTLTIWLTHALTTFPDWPRDDAEDAWAHYHTAGWLMSSGNPVRSWQSAMKTCYSRWKRGAQKNTVGRGAPAFDPNKPDAHTGGLQVFEGGAAAGGAT